MPGGEGGTPDSVATHTARFYDLVTNLLDIGVRFSNFGGITGQRCVTELCQSQVSHSVMPRGVRGFSMQIFKKCEAPGMKRMNHIIHLVSNIGTDLSLFS